MKNNNEFMDKKIKISSTAYRVLLLLLHLSQEQCNVEYLNEVFSSDKITSRYFSKEVILKYISTLRTAGYDISKPSMSNSYKYELNKSPVLIDLSNSQLKNLAVMLYYAESLHQNKIIDNYNSFLKKIKKLLPEKQIQFLTKELIEKIEKFIIENQRVSVIYKLNGNETENSIVLELKNLKYDQDDTYVFGYNPITEQTHCIKLNQIVKIKQLPTKSQYNHILSPVIFNLTGLLAKVYRPYENEKITNTNENLNMITVAAYVDDKDTLIKRLLKYGENCEVIYPKHVRNEISKIINQTLENYEKA